MAQLTEVMFTIEQTAEHALLKTVRIGYAYTIEGAEAGIYHAACQGHCSWFELATATLEYAGIDGVAIEPCSTDAFPRPAQRPAYSVLDCTRLTDLRGKPLADWKDALKTYLGNADS